jgi:hypothetical protein
MASNDNLASDILRYRGGLNKNNLVEIFKNIDNYEEMLSCCSQSPYIGLDNAKEYFERFKDKFTLLDFNIQSLNAKFDIFVSFLDDLASTGFYFSVICLQETWINNNLHDTSMFNIPQYSLIHMPAKLSAHSGVALYIHDSYCFKQLHDIQESNVCECIFAEITGNGLHKKTIIGNFYRPPRDNNLNIKQFLKDLASIVNTLTVRNTDCVFCGDFNIDLLKIETRSLFSEYLELIYAMSFIPSITLPTRLSRRNATLIDHIFVKTSPDINHTSAVIVNNISDHFMPVICIDKMKYVPHKPKLISIQKQDNNSIQKFVSSVCNTDFISILDTDANADPNENYERLKATITNLLQTHLPHRSVKLNKHKHRINSWITPGCVHSIKTRDKMYRKLKKISPDSTEYERLKINLNTYNRILRKSLRQAKFLYYSSQFQK